MEKRNIFIGSDHAGFSLKQWLIGKSESEGWRFDDRGCFSEQPCDYPAIAHQVASRVSQEEGRRGILICGSGVGMSIVANRYKGVFAALVHTVAGAKLACRHNRANILALGARDIDSGLARDIVAAWLEEGFEGGRHQQRLDLIDQQQAD